MYKMEQLGRLTCFIRANDEKDERKKGEKC